MAVKHAMGLRPKGLLLSNFFEAKEKAKRSAGGKARRQSESIGKKRAIALVESAEKRNNFFTSNPNSRQKYETNLKMIKFHDIDNDDSNFNFWPGIPDWETVKEKFTEYNFSSIINDKSWNKFVTTFKMGA